MQKLKCKVENCEKNVHSRGFCNPHYLKDKRKRIPDIDKKYEKTINGFLMRTYRNMKSRVTGIQKLKAHLYLGKELLPKEDFYNWSKNNLQFQNLYKNWVINNYDQKLSPSINRIDPNIGYRLDNIEWITHSMNSKLGTLSRYGIIKRN